MVVFLLGQSLRVVVVLCTYITNSETQAVQLFVRGLFINNPSLLHIVTIISKTAKTMLVLTETYCYSQINKSEFLRKIKATTKCQTAM